MGQKINEVLDLASNLNKKRDEADKNFKQIHFPVQNKLLDKEKYIENLKQISDVRNKPRHFCFQLYYLTKLAFFLFFKNRASVTLNIIFVLIMNWFILILYQDLGDIDDDTYAAIRNRQGFLFVIYVLAFFTGLNSTLLSLIAKKKIFVKDFHGRYYSKSAFFLSEQLVNIPIFGVVYAVTSLCAYLFLKLNPDPWMTRVSLFLFFIFVGGVLGGSSLGFFIGSVTDNMEPASLLIPLVALPLMLCNGFFANLKDSTFAVRAFSYLSLPRFIFQGLMLNEFQNYQQYIDSCRLPRPCRPFLGEEQCFARQSNPICDPRNTADFIEKDIWQNVVACLGLIAGFRALSFVVFLYVNRDSKLEHKENKQLRNKIYNFLNKSVLIK